MDNPSNIPKHIGIIMDGNRRYAKKIKWKPWQGHEAGAEKVEKIADWCKELGINEVTLYAFSLENFNRDKQEVSALMNIFRKEFKRLLSKEKIEEKIQFIGAIQLFPADIYHSMQELMRKTSENTKYKVNFAMAYDGRAEILTAAKSIANDIKEGKLRVEDINEQEFEKHLYLQSRPDLIIRTSGEQRISGFLLWQGSYAEFYFTPKLWPEFSKEDLVAAVKDYSERQRRFGK